MALVEDPGSYSRMMAEALKLTLLRGGTRHLTPEAVDRLAHRIEVRLNSLEADIGGIGLLDLRPEGSSVYFQASSYQDRETQVDPIDPLGIIWLNLGVFASVLATYEPSGEFDEMKDSHGYSTSFQYLTADDIDRAAESVLLCGWPPVC